MEPSPKILSLEANRQWARRIYQKLRRAVPDLPTIVQSAMSQVEGCMDLRLDVIKVTEVYRPIALGHYRKQTSGELLSDPRITIAAYLDWEMAEALAFEDRYTSEEVYAAPGGEVDSRCYVRLNSLLEVWLETWADQGQVFHEANENPESRRK